jgi:hypothetical protein
MSKGFTDNNIETLIDAMGGYLSSHPSKMYSIREEPWFLEAVKFRLNMVSSENIISGYKELISWRQNYDLNKAAEEDMGRLSPGDRVKILRAPTEEEKRRWPLWIEAMSAFIGEIGVIEGISPERMDCRVKIIPNLGGPHSHCTVWTFPKNVLEKVQTVQTVQTVLPDIPESIAIPNPKPKFKVGDKVRVLRAPTIDEPFRHSWTINSMDKTVSLTGIVSTIIGELIYVGFPDFDIGTSKEYYYWVEYLEVVSTTPNLSPTPTLTKGESTMNLDEIRVLQKLASKTEVDDLSKYTVALADGTEDAIKELLANEAKEAAMAQAHIILSIVRKAEAKLDDQVAALRYTRATEKAQLSTLRKIVRARDYAAESKNYLPLVFLLDGSVDGVNPEDCRVPESWQPEVKA